MPDDDEISVGWIREKKKGVIGEEEKPHAAALQAAGRRGKNRGI